MRFTAIHISVPDTPEAKAMLERIVNESVLPNGMYWYMGRVMEQRSASNADPDSPPDGWAAIIAESLGCV